MKTNMINCNSIKTYICAIVLMLGFSVSAWGLTLVVPQDDGSYKSLTGKSQEDMTYATATSELSCGYNELGSYVSLWISYPISYASRTSSKPSGYNDKSATVPDGTYYAVFAYGSPNNYFTEGACPASCTYTLSDPSSLSSNTRYDDSGTEKVKLSWSCGSDITSHGTYLEFECGAYGESATYSYSNVGTDKTNWKQTRSSFSNGKYWWSIQALGDGVTYCSSSTKVEYFCIDDVDQSTPSGLAASSVTTNSATISWTAMSDAEGYIITVKKKSDGTKVTGFDEKDVSGTFVSVTGLSQGVTYVVELYAYNACADFSETNDDLEFTTLVEYNITLDGNGVSDGLAGVYTNATSLHDITAPTKTGYNLEGYYTTDACATKIASSAGALVANITVSSTPWTDENGKWVLGDDATFYAKWEAKECTVTLLKNNSDVSGSSNGTAVVSYDETSLTSISAATRTGYHLTGYWEGASTGNQVLDANGDFHATAVTGWITGGKWSKDATSANLYARWEANTHKLKVPSIDNVTITATPSGSSAVSEGADPVTVSYGTTITLNYSSVTGSKNWAGWKVYKDGDAGTTVSVSGTGDGATFTMPDYDVVVSANLYGDFVFSCSELTLTPHLVTEGTPIFITSTANKKVRSQDYIEISGSGLTPSTALTFPGLNSKFEVLTSTGGTISTDANGEISVNAYIFYTPAADATTDGLDKLTGISVSVGGAKPITKQLTQDIIGRHLPTAGYVIAGKKDNKWYAMPSNMVSTTNPKPSEIAVDDYINPSIAYTAASNVYGLEGPTTSGGSNNISSGNGQYVRLTMSIDDGTLDPHAAPLFGSATGTRTIGKSGNSQASSDLSAGWWWALTQTNTSITNPQDAKYIIKCANNTSTLSLRDNAGNPDWGLFASGVEELRLIPASSTPFTEGEIVEWGQHKAIVEVYPYSGGNYANTVDASINGITKTGLAVSQTLTSVKSGATKYNYTVDFTSDIDFSTLAGKTLLLEWKYNGTSIGVCSMVVPRIIATSSTMSVIESRDTYWTSQNGPSDDVHVLPDVILTADAGSFGSSDVTIKNLEIYPGATVKVTTGTLDVTNLVFRNGWSRAGEKFFDVSRMYIADDANLMHTNAYADWYIDFDRWYPIAVPWPVTVSGITYKNSNASITVGPTGRVRLQYYDGAKRATGSGTGSNWQKYGEDGKLSVPTTLVPSQGYSITAQRPTGKAFSIVRMPLRFANVWTTDGEQGSVEVEAVTTKKNEVSVTAHGKNSDKPWYTKCWNFVANPYMAAYNANESGITGKVLEENGSTVKYATILDPTTDDYDQIVLNDGDNEVGLKPQAGFFVQVEETGTLTFSQNMIIAPTAPARYTNETDAIPEQEAYIRLSGENGTDQMGLIIGADYTANYEINADLSKILGEANTLKTYLHYTDMDFAYLAINEQLASEEIPVTVKIPAAGEYTYSLRNSSTVDQLEGLYLIDHLTNTTANLIYDDYTFTSTTAGTISNRFAINAVVGERQVPTEVDISGADKDGTAVKFIWHDKVYVLHNNVIYDSTGKRVYEINK